MRDSFIPKIDLKKLKISIRNFEKLEYNNYSIKEIVDYLNPIFHGYAIASLKFSHPIAIYRSVKWDILPKEIKCLSFPPTDRIKNFGRINDVGETYFYGCFNWEPTLNELDLNEGDTVAVSMWQTSYEILITPIGYSSAAFYQIDAIRSLPENVKPKNIKVLMRKNNILVDEFLSKSFTRIINSCNDYKLSVAIAKLLLKNDKSDGILYPSIVSRGLSENVALKPEAVVKKLVFNEARFIKVGKKDGLFYNTLLMYKTKSVNKKGTIEWAEV